MLKRRKSEGGSEGSSKETAKQHNPFNRKKGEKRLYCQGVFGHSLFSCFSVFVVGMSSVRVRVLKKKT